ncbi:15 kDa selenoprotein precursor, putative [Pediculus humanus corporis]|uniref:Selenoprotein F n=1 Tax=Pediculus humanus subsp. corporis TaxID=121224 RepID=E0VEG0_PEDHC|nr:15 kDa selenoprotein precursor, putative [Pediculus humanus corporis]EEB11766.1 15 kDa selenoprotein precursor, putative [Pediculus humanus corporis]
MYSEIYLTFIILIFNINFYKVFAEFRSDDCAHLGYNKANLLCSTCDQLTEFKLDTLKETCYECCNKDDVQENIKKYAKARLEVCTCKFGAYPQIEAFIKSDRPTKFPNLTIRYVRGLDPIIKLMDKEGNVVETLAIDKWNTDSVEEFLKTYLEPVNNVNLDYLKTNLV